MRPCTASIVAMAVASASVLVAFVAFVIRRVLQHWNEVDRIYWRAKADIRDADQRRRHGWQTNLPLTNQRDRA